MGPYPWSTKLQELRARGASGVAFPEPVGLEEHESQVEIMNNGIKITQKAVRNMRDAQATGMPLHARTMSPSGMSLGLERLRWPGPPPAQFVGPRRFFSGDEDIVARYAPSRWHSLQRAPLRRAQRSAMSARCARQSGPRLFQKLLPQLKDPESLFQALAPLGALFVDDSLEFTLSRALCGPLAAESSC